MGYGAMACGKTISKEQCDALSKKYKIIEKMYNDPDLMEMLKTDAYNDFHRELEEAGIQFEGTMEKKVNHVS